MKLETARLVLRPWQERDRAPYIRINADPVVRRFYPDLNTPETTSGWIDRYIRKWHEDGISFFVVERKSDGAFIGDVGVSRLDYPVPGDPEFEIGWLTDSRFWGRGYAPEAAHASLDFAWKTVPRLPEIVAFTSRRNHPSRRVMEKIGMVRDPARDFEHPKVPPGHPLGPHVLYSIANPGKPVHRRA
ncbi:MAG TPA: GNAT family N-acetyltransferase [Devosiaceae bacterium]|nr:GNAT family N-acetyltransferase [Devosiaceae bacterium]